MKTLLALPSIFLGVSLTLYYQLLNGIGLTKGILLFASTLLFFFICIIFLVYHRETKHYTDSLFLSIMLSGVTIPVCFLVFNHFMGTSTFWAISSSTFIYVAMLSVGIRIVKKWYNYKVPYFGN